MKDVISKWTLGPNQGIEGHSMSDQYTNEENLELLDAMEIGIQLSDYEQMIQQLAEDIFKPAE